MLDIFYISSIIRRNGKMINKIRILSRIEELVLLSVWHLKDEAYGVTIRKHIIQYTGKEWSIGAIYVPLERLTKWGYLTSSQGESKPERGGRSRRYYRIMNAGLEALKHTKKVHEKMWSLLSEVESDMK